MAGKSVVRELVTLWGFDIDSQPLRELDTGLNVIKSSLKHIGIAVAATATGIGFLLNEAGKQEQTNVAFETMIGNAERAQVLIRDLQEFAARTPFTIPGIERNAKLLLGMGIEVDKLLPTLKALGDVSAGLSVPLGRIALNFGQIKAQGKLTGRELRDFAVAGVPLLAELAKQFGKTEAQVTKMISSGKVGFADVEKAFISMSSEGGRFNNLMIKQSKTFKGLISNVQDFGIIFARELGQEILPMAKEIVLEFSEWLRINRKIVMSNFKEFLKSLVGFFKDLITLISTFKKVLDGVVKAFGGWNKVLKTTMKLFTGIMGVGLLIGIGLITKAIWGMVAAFAANLITAGANLAAFISMGGVLPGLSFGLRALGNTALFAQAKMALIPLAIGAIAVAIALIAEDIIAFSQGRDSVFGRMISGLDVILSSVKEKFGIFGEIGARIVATLLTPIRAVVNGFKNIMTIIDMIRGKIGFMKGLKDIGSGIMSTLGFGATDSAASMFGMADGVGAATDQVSAGNNAFSATGGMSSKSDKGVNKSVSVNSKVDMNLNVTGMNKEDAENLITGKWTDSLDNVLRSAVRDGESQIER